MSAEVVFLKPRFVPQALPGGLGVAVQAEESRVEAAPRVLQLPAPQLVRINVCN